MSEVRLCASHPDYKKFVFMQHLLLMAINPQMFFGFEVDVPESERLATVEKIKENIEKEIDNYQFLPPSIAKIINNLEEDMSKEINGKTNEEIVMRVFKDGDSWVFVLPNFENLRVSPSVWFSDREESEALDNIYKKLTEE